MGTIDLGIIGNSRIAALVDPAARIVWWCYPRFDSPPVCSALLASGRESDGAGSIDVVLEGGSISDRFYVRNTAILVTRLSTADGTTVEVTDFAPRFRRFGRMFAPAMLVRIVRRVSGRPRVSLRVRPARDRGCTAAPRTTGSHHIRFDLGVEGLRLTTDGSITHVVDETPFGLEESMTLLIGPDEPIDGHPRETGREFLDQTQSYWKNWVRNLAIPFEWQEAVIRAAITLKLNAFDDTGAIIAAATTSIPEAPGSGRTWDYRYCWLRDAYFVVNALNRLGATGTLVRYLHYLQDLIGDAHGRALQPVYGIARESQLIETTEPRLAGFRGMGPVRFGNDAWRQVQHDVHGEAILAVAHAFFDERLDTRAGSDVFAALEALGEHACATFGKPDAGLWELRGTLRIHTFSAVMNWAACDRLARIATRLGHTDRARHWETRAAGMHREICERAWNPELGSFVSVFDGRNVDACLLLLVELLFLRADDPRFAATVATVERVLRRGDFLLRYDEEDDFGRPETAFLVCTQWWVLALAQIGQVERARAVFDRVLGVRNSLGLLSEDVVPATGELWGNFPQTYTMVGLIQCALRLSRPWDEVY